MTLCLDEPNLEHIDIDSPREAYPGGFDLSDGWEDPFADAWLREMKALNVNGSLQRIKEFVVFFMECRTSVTLAARLYGISRTTATRYLVIAHEEGWITEREPAERIGEGTLPTVRLRRCFWSEDLWGAW